MAIADDFAVATNGNITYTGDAHGLSTAGYYTVIEFHRWLQDLADDAVASSVSSDYMDMTFDTPSSRQTDNIIELINGYSISQTVSEHLYDGSIIQNGGDDIWDGLVVLANQGMNLQIIQNNTKVANDFWNYDIVDTATGGSTTTMVDSGATFGTNSELVGYYIENTTEGCWGVITSHDNTTITCSAGFEEGTNQDFAAADGYRIVKGLNADAVSGYSHRFMLKVRTAGSDIDGKRLIGQTRVWYKTYSEFRIGTGTARGNNVLALTYAADLNNTTAVSTVAAWSISNTAEGYQGIDVNADTTNEFYYSQWNANKPTNSINDFYEKAKWITRQDTTQTLYASTNGELFRGITHEIPLDSADQSATDFSAVETVSWTGGSGIMVAVDDINAATTMWIQLTTGSAPGLDVQITGGTSGATTNTHLTNGAIERTLSFPFVGQSTGSALIGAYGVGVETNDLTSNDKITALDNVVYTPPNVQNFYVTGLYDDEDYILVGPYDATTGINYNQMAINATLNTNDAASVVIGHANGDVTAGIPSDTPATGWIRVEDDTGRYRRLKYSSWTGSTFTIDTAWHTANDSQNDFGGAGDTGAATLGNNLFVSYIDELASGNSVTTGSFSTGVEYRITNVGDTDFTLIGAASNTVGVIFTATGAGGGTTGTANTTAASATFQATYGTDRDLWVRARDGGAGKGDTPIKTFESKATFGSAGGTSTVIRTSDA